jgi:hypothetical protein
LAIEKEGQRMARISKEDHPAILRMVDVENRKVSEVAAEFGCTPANIYVLLGKLRRSMGEASGQGAAQQPLALDQAPPTVTAVVSASEEEHRVAELEPAIEPAKPDRPESVETAPPSEENGNVLSFERTTLSAVLAQETGQTEVRAVEPVSSASPPAPKAARPPARTSGPAPTKVGAKLAKPGVGLVMRTADGEESLAPFRSLDDLLSAIKPILRASARSADPVWFSLQPVDLSVLDSDAA